jgi:triacylglycerol lipase
MLAHGVCPFSRLYQPLAGRNNDPDDRFHYFRLIRSTLLRHGYTVFHTRVSWAGSLERRARDLRDEILRLTEGFRRWPRVHIIAHSMGGLDARSMLFTHRMENRVASLTTIGSPHLGTSYADWGVRRFPFLIAASRTFGLSLDGLRDLTRERCRRFNEETASYEAGNGVPYRTVAGSQPLERIFLPMRFASRIIQREEGANDGLVPLASAVWKEDYHLATLDADHLNQIGWWDRGEGTAGLTRSAFESRIRRFYVELASGLED